MRREKLDDGDHINSNESEHHAIEKQQRRSERVAVAAQKRDKEEACLALMQVASCETKQVELAVRRLKEVRRVKRRSPVIAASTGLIVYFSSLFCIVMVCR
jgi:hypothetical protein